MEWIRSVNLNKFDLIKAFEHREMLDWTKGPFGIEAGDIVYLYVGLPYSKIMYKTICIDDSVDAQSVLDDRQYWKHPEEFSKSKKFIRLKKLEFIDNDKLSLDTLTKKKLIEGRIQGAYKSDHYPELFEYINRIFDNQNVSENEKDVISFPVGETYDLVTKYKIHSHPIKKGFPTNVKPYITLRQTGGYMRDIYQVVKTIDLFPEKVYLSKQDLSENEINRIENYIKERKTSYGFSNKEVPYRFYVLKNFQKIEPPMQLIPNPRSYIYYSLKDLMVDTDFKQTEELETVVYAGKEGNQKQYYVTKYERNPENRKEAIRIHGCKCQVCGFDFEKTYGDLGKGYIEVHHTKQLYSLDEEMVVNPETDLVCVCANCHRMLHRKKNEIVTVEKLSKYLMS